MFLNMTGETCTGTGDVLTLTGALAGHNAFGKTGNADDGGLYQCALEDADGVVKVAGIYTFDKTANTLTRNDSWNSTATAVDKNPSSNIALSGGVHTVWCSETNESIRAESSNSKSYDPNYIINGIMNSGYGATGSLMSTSHQVAFAFKLMETSFITNLVIPIYTADPAGSAEVGLTRMINGKPEGVYLGQSAIDITATGDKTVAINKMLSAGWYLVHFVTNSALVKVQGTGRSFGNAGIGWTPLRKTLYAQRNNASYVLDIANATSSLVADPSTVLGVSTATTSTMIYQFRMQR